MATVAEQIQKVYIGLLGRAADKAGLDYWTGEIESGALTLEQLRANIVEEQPEYQNGIGQMTRAQAVNQLYQNLFNRSAEDEGLNYWVNGEGADVSFDQLVLALVDGASAADTLALDNKVQVAAYYTEQAGDNYTSNGATAAVDDVDGGSNIADAKTAVDDALSGEGSNLVLTQRADDLQGTDGDDVFTAPVTQNETGSGALANTFETGDKIDGAGGNNTLKADLIATGTIQGGIIDAGAAISAETNNIQDVFLRAQAVQFDVGGSNTTFSATVDAEKMAGVEQWWSDNSRADIRIEDIRTATEDTTFGMRSTDPEVGFEAYFNPLYMEGDLTADSSLSLVIQEITNGQAPGATELDNITVREVNFTLDGDDVVLASDDITAANTWDELQTAIEAEIAEQNLDGVSVSHQGDGLFVIDDAQGRVFEAVDGEALIFGAATDIDVRNRVEVGRLEQEGPTETNLVLDGAGNGSRGGDVNIAAMSGDRGIEVMNVQVDRDSHIRTLRSENNPNDTGSFSQEQQLEEVNLTHVVDGAEGAFQLGSRTVDSAGVSTTTDDRLNTDGLLDVRKFDATGFSSEIKLGAELSDSVFDKYLDGAEDTVQFSYLLGDGGNNLSLEVDNGVASDPDFALEIMGGAQDDRINLTDLQFKNSTVIDGKEGENTVEVNTTTGAVAGGNTAEENSWSSFDNIQNLVVAGTNDTVQNLVVGNMEGLEQVTVATAGGADTDLQQMRMDQDLTISGKNQTLGSGSSNNPQTFGDIDITNTSAVTGVDSFGVTLDNTARVDGEMQIDALNVVDSTTVGGSNNISTLDISSTGRRQTENLVKSAALSGVNTVNLDGSQNLDLHIASMEVDGSGVSTDSIVDGSELGGDLDLAMNADILNGANDEITGTEAATDTLAVYGADAQASVKDVETIQLGLAASNQFTSAVANFQGTFNAAAVSGVEQYNVVALNGATTVDNLGNSEVVNVTTATANQDLTLVAASRDGGSEIDVNFDEVTAGNGWANGANTLTVQDIRTVNLDLAEGDYDFNLDLLGAAADTYARTLNITGGTEDVTDSSLDIGELDTALTTVDLSGFTGTLENASWDSMAGSNAQVTGNAYDFTFDVGGLGVIQTTVAGASDQIAFDNGGALSVTDGQTVIVNFDGSSFTYTNDTGATFGPGDNGDLAEAIVEQAKAENFTDFALSVDSNNLIVTTDDGLITSAVATIDAASSGTADELVTAAQATVNGDVSYTGEFISEFIFEEDAAEAGVLWQIDNFQVFGQGDIDLSNQSIIDLTALDVDSAAKINVQDGKAFFDAIDADANGTITTAELEAAGYTDTSNLSDFNALGTGAAGDNAVVTSNDGKDFTIVLTGVDANDLVNENFAGIA